MSMKRKALIGAIMAAVACGGLLVTARAVAQGGDRAAKVGQLMDGIMRPNFGTARGAARTAPADDDGWKALTSSAAALNELSYSLMEAGRAKDDVWKTAVEDNLRAGSAALLAAAEAKDASKIGDAVMTIGNACRTCHEKHRQN